MLPVWGFGLLGFVLGVALQLKQVQLSSGWIYTGLGALGAAIWLGSKLARSPRAAWALVGLAGCLIGTGLTGARATHYLKQALDPQLQDSTVLMTGRIASLPQRQPRGARFEFVVESASVDGQAVSVPPRVQLAWYGAGSWDTQTAPTANSTDVPGMPNWRAGDRWRLSARLRIPHGNANPFGFDRERWLWEQGLGATGTVRHGPREAAPKRLGASGSHRLQSWRQSVSLRITERVPDPRTAGVLAALVVGDQSAIDSDDWALFRTTGVAHLMSISGLHVTMFAWLATLVVAALWRSLALRWPGAALRVPVPLAAGVGGLLMALAYALFSGWGVPAQRTVLMLAVVLALRVLGREWPWPLVWLLAMVAVLLLDPWALLQAGFWLSFVAVGILFASALSPLQNPSADDGQRWFGPRRVLAAVRRQLREQTVVTLALAPLTVLLFGQVSVVGWVANMLAIPWVTLLVTPLAMLGVLWAPIWTAAAWAVRALDGWLAWLAQWSWAALYWPIAPLPLSALALFGGVLLVLRLPWVLRALGCLLLWPALGWQVPRPAAGNFEVTALDVGQGSAVLVRTAGHSLLFDTGPRYSGQSNAGERVVVPLLRALGERPDTVVVSHKDSDHDGGSTAVRAAFPQARWLSSFDADLAQRCLAGQRWTWDGVDFEVLHPSPEHYAPPNGRALSTNAMSCTLLVSADNTSAWLSGDLDAEHETRLALNRPDLRATLMLAPHHGSKTSSSPVLLNTLRPSVVIVQAGFRNPFGHPAEVVLQRYRQREIPWRVSHECGAATWQNGAPGQVFCWRDTHRRYWQAPPDSTLSKAPAEEGVDTP